MPGWFDRDSSIVFNAGDRVTYRSISTGKIVPGVIMRVILKDAFGERRATVLLDHGEIVDCGYDALRTSNLPYTDLAKSGMIDLLAQVRPGILVRLSKAQSNRTYEIFAIRRVKNQQTVLDGVERTSDGVLLYPLNKVPLVDVVEILSTSVLERRFNMSDITTKSQLYAKEATVVAALNAKVKLASCKTLTDVGNAWFDVIHKDDPSIDPETIDRMIAEEIASFERELAKGDQFGGLVVKADEYLVKIKLISQAELDTLKKLPESTVRKGRTERAPKPETANAAIAVSVGDQVKIGGRSWEGFTATIERIEGPWAHIVCKLPKSVYHGRVRLSNIIEVIPSAAKAETAEPAQLAFGLGEGEGVMPAETLKAKRGAKK